MHKPIKIYKCTICGDTGKVFAGYKNINLNHKEAFKKIPCLKCEKNIAKRPVVLEKLFGGK